MVSDCLRTLWDVRNSVFQLGSCLTHFKEPIPLFQAFVFDVGWHSDSIYFEGSFLKRADSWWLSKGLPRSAVLKLSYVFSQSSKFKISPLYRRNNWRQSWQYFICEILSLHLGFKTLNSSKFLMRLHRLRTAVLGYKIPAVIVSVKRWFLTHLLM